MKFDSKPTGMPVNLYIFGLAVTGIVFWTLPRFQPELTALYQLVSMLFFAGALYLLIRYRLTVFRLRIEGKNGDAVDLRYAMPSELDFAAERVQGKKILPLARISLDRLKSIDRVRYSELKSAVHGASLYKYYAAMSPEEGYLLIFDDDDRDIAIFTELSSDMFVFLKKITADGGVA